MLRVFPLISLATMVLACHPTPIAVRRWVGCYELTRGQWIRDSLQPRVQIVLPDTIALRGRTAVLHSDTSGYQLEPQIFDPARRGAGSGWQVMNDTVQLTWTDGFSGVWLWFSVADSGFAGRAEYFTDVQRTELRPDGSSHTVPWPTASVRLRSIRCGSFAAA